MLSARGKFLLFADADGATRFKDIESLEREMARMIASKWVSYKVHHGIKLMYTSL